jgi:hypothetical protein
MKRLLSVIAIVGLAIPAFAQDDFGFGGGDSVLTGNDINALFGGGNRGGQRNNNDNIPDPETMLLQLKDLLKNKKAPLTKDQEKTSKLRSRICVQDWKPNLGIVATTAETTTPPT